MQFVSHSDVKNEGHTQRLFCWACKRKVESRDLRGWVSERRDVQKKKRERAGERDTKAKGVQKRRQKSAACKRDGEKMSEFRTRNRAICKVDQVTC